MLRQLLTALGEPLVDVVARPGRPGRAGHRAGHRRPGRRPGPARPASWCWSSGPAAGTRRAPCGRSAAPARPRSRSRPTGPVDRAARRGGRDRRRPAHGAPRRALGTAGVAGPRRARRRRPRTTRTGRATCSRWPRRSPCSPAASWSSRTPRAGCWPTRARTATPPRSTSCAGCRSWAGRGRRTTCGCCASGACSTGCAPARRWCTSTSAPELGIRARLAVGIHAGQRWLGTIWVQEGAEPFAERAEDVLLGAARVAAGHLIRRRSQQAPGARWTRELVAGLLDGRTDPELVASTFGLDADGADAGGGVRGAGRRPGHATSCRVAELTEVVTVHAASYRRSALAAAQGARVYAVLPERAAGPGRAHAGRDVRARWPR